MSMITMSAIGRLGRDPEFKSVGDKQVCNFSVAVDVWKKGGKATQWVNVASWSERTNKVVKDFVIKGSQVYVSGQPSVRTFEGRDGFQAVLELDITFGSLTLCGGKAEQGDRVPDGAGRASPAPSGGRAPASTAAMIDDDIPF
jgi:single-strand DNA-binding protein